MEPLPEWLTPLLDAEKMRGVDRWAIEEQGIDGLELMERAGAAVAGAAERLTADGPVVVLCGKGNNGGDGLVAARLLRQAGHDVTVLSAAPPQELRGDALANLERLPGEPPLRLDGSPWEGTGNDAGSVPIKLLEKAGVAIDALLGTGFEGEPRGPVAAAIEALNASAAAVLSVDVPSGVDASTGQVAGIAVCATATVTFHAAKPGLWINPGKARAGAVDCAEIGVPRGAPMESAIGLIDDRALELLPHRGVSSTKFVSGHVLLAGGSVGLSGAPAMAARAAMRAGAGYVTAFVPEPIQPVLAAGGTPELMTRGVAAEGDGFAPGAVEEVLAAAERGGALALGPGLGRSEGALAFARRLAAEAPLAMVLDADGLNAHAGRLADLAGRSHPTVLTPHAGELARLLELDSAEVEARRLHHVREVAARAGSVVVLKGDDTLVADPTGRVAVSRGGSPALATAGTGDVLTGTIAALLSQQVEPFAAAACAVLLHARAGRLAAQRLGAVEGVIAGDVIEQLPRARSTDARPLPERPAAAPGDSRSA